MSIVEQISNMNLVGNVIPHTWFQHIKKESGKPDLTAIIILSEIVYWYRGQQVKDEHTGDFKGVKKRFSSDKLQKSYQSLAEQFGLSKRQVKEAMDRLEKQGLIKREFRTLKTDSGLVITNVLFIEPVPENIKKISKIKEIEKKQNEKTDHLLRKNVRGSYEKTQHIPTKKRNTYTKTTTEITTQSIEDIDIVKKPAKKPKKTLEKSKSLNDLVALFNKTCISLPSVKKLSEKRKRALNTLLKEFSLEEIREGFKKAEASDFLSGRNGKWLGCNFDWLINKNNMLKVLEGTYDNMKNTRQHELSEDELIEKQRREYLEGLPEHLMPKY